MASKAGYRPPQQKLFQFAFHLWEVYEHSRKHDSAAVTYWPVAKLASLYLDFFKEPLSNSWEELLEKVPIFNVGAANKVSISKEKLVNFLVVSTVGSDCVNEKHFCEKFARVTGLDVKSVYSLLKKKSFAAFAQSLCSKSSLFRIKGGGSAIKLFIPQGKQLLLNEHTAIHSVFPVPTVKTKRNRTDTKHQTSHSDSTNSEADLDPPPHKLHCAAVDSFVTSSSIGQPIPVQVSDRKENSWILSGEPHSNFPMSATRVPTAAKADSHASHMAESQARRQSQPLPSSPQFYTDNFPPLGAQTPPMRPASGGANLHSAFAPNRVPLDLPVMPSRDSREHTLPMHAASGGANLHSAYAPNRVPLDLPVMPSRDSREHAASGGANFHSASAPNRDSAQFLPLVSQDNRAARGSHLSTPPPTESHVFPNPDTPNEVVLPAHPTFHPHMDPATTNLSVSLTFKDKRGRPNSSQEAAKKINARLEAIIDDLASIGKFVPEPVVRRYLDQLLQQCYRAGCRSVGKRDVQAYDKYSKIHGRIAELIQIFCWMSPITSLHELNRALIVSEGVSTFEELRLGPLIKHPSVAKFFQPPPDLQDIPEITAHQIQKMLMKFLDKTRKAAAKGEKHLVTDFLEFFAKQLSKPSPHHLCVRITSFPLAIQTNYRFRRTQRESRDRVQHTIDEEMKKIVTHEIDQVRRKLASFNDPLTVNRYLTAKDPIVLLTDIFSIFLDYLSGYQSAKVNGFLQLLSNPNHQWVRQMFMLAIYRGAYGVERGISEIREELPQSRRQPEEILHKSQGEVLDIVLRHLSRLQYPIDLSSLAAVEKAIANHFAAPSFQVLNNVSFLNFLVSDKHCKSSLGGSLTVGAAPIDDGRKKATMDIVSQLRAAERSSQDAVTETLKLQCGVTAIDQVYCGNIEKLISDVAMHEKKEGMAAQKCVLHLTPLLVNGANDSNLYKQWSCPSVGVLGHKTRQDAVTCLKQAPLLEDLARWSHWDLIFKPQHGELARFIEREGPQNGLQALEIAPGTLLRVDPEASRQKFLEAVEAMDPVHTAGELVSIVIQQGSVHELSVKLLGNYVQTALERLVSSGSNEGSVDGTQVAAQFIYRCLIRIPHKISHFLSKEVFLEPLRRVSSNTVVEDLLNQCRRTEGGAERRHLQALGMGIGIKAWADDFTAMLGEAENAKVMKPNSAAPTVVEPYSVDGPTSIDIEPYTGTRPATSSPIPADADFATVPEDQLNTSLPLSDVSDTEKETQCRAVVEDIRSEEFGIGLKLDGHQKEVAEKQRQREGRGLQRLSKELYSKDTHFVLELIQNGDDNSYHKSLLSSFSKSVPALKFIVGPSSVVVLNNELGFSEKNVRAICDVGRSTKGAHHSGYIGQKGIGFKSVFRVTDKPEIHSGGYHIRFDAECDAIGYILPHWIEEDDRESAAIGAGWNTTIVLPLKADRQAMSLVTKFQDVRPSLLLFLHRLRSITVEHQETGTLQYMKRFDGEKGIIKIEHNTNTSQDQADVDTWLVVRKQLTNASQFKVDVEATEVALAFPLSPDMKTVVLAKDLQHQQVFAFLPLRSYGFRFIVQGDFDLPSSREDVNRDSAWNQWIRDEIPQLFLHALENIKKLPDLLPTVAVALYLQFIPLDGELHDFFKPVAIQILNLLRGTACLPTEPGSDHIDEPFSIIQNCYHRDPDESSALPYLWKQPSQLVVVRDDYIRKHIPQSLLNSALRLFYLSSEITPFLNAPLQSQLGVQNLSIDHLITIAEAVLKSYSGKSQDVVMLSDSDDGSLCSDDEESDGKSSKKPTTSHTVFVQWVAYWFACVHIVLEEEGDRNPVTIDKLKKIKIIPLTNGARLAAQDGSLFFPADGDRVNSTEFKGLFDEIMVVDSQLFESQRDSGTSTKPSFRVHSVLELLGVREIYPAEVIRYHILPCFQNEQWKSKSRALLTTYLVYIKDSIGMQGSGITETEMVSLFKDCVALATKKHGVRQPANDVLHFSSQFQPSYDFEKLFPDVQWMLVSPDYLKKLKSRQDILSWQRFLQKLGVHNTLTVTKFNESVPEDSKQWMELRNFVGRSPDGSYTLQDYKCSEFEGIVQSVKSKKQQHQQMLELVKLLDKLWDEEYKQYAFARCYDGSNTNYLGGDQSVPSSFHKSLKDLAWLPAISFPSGEPYAKQGKLFRGRDLFYCSKAIKALLDCHVPYIAVELKNHMFLELLQVKCSINAEEMIAFLQEWSKASTIPGTQFRASIAHMTAIYTFLYTYISSHQSVMVPDIQEKFSSSDPGLIFVPDEYSNHVPSEHVVGQFYSIHNVCWVDPSTVLYTKQKWNHSLPTDLPKVLQLHYGVNEKQNQDVKIAFQHFGVREVPTAAAYINTLQYVSSLAAIPEKHHINDFTSIALHLSCLCMQGHITPQFLRQSLKESKIFPSHRGLWVSLDSCLLERDDAQLAKFFAECQEVHFLQWPAEFQKKSRYQREQQKEDERRHFVNVCGISNLSDVIETRVVPKGSVMPLENLRRRLNVMVPLIQRYLVANEDQLYRSLQQENIKEKLSKMFIGSVTGLDCLYSINYHGISIASPTMSSPGSEFMDSSEEDTSTLYVVASKVESPKCLVPTMVKIFTSKKIGFEDTRNFETLVKDMLLGPIEEIESILSDQSYSFGEVGDSDVWIVPVCKEPETDVSESEDDEDSCVDENDANMEAEERSKLPDSDGLKSWPPRAPPAWVGDSTKPAKPPPPGSSIADTVGEDDIQRISEKYAMSTAKPLSRQTSHDHASSPGLPQSTLRDKDRNESSVSSHHPSPSFVQPPLGHGMNQQTLTEGVEHLHDHGPGTREDTNLSTRGGGVDKGQNWHESAKPEAALTQSSFSVASALQSISDGSAQLHPFLDDSDQESRELVGRWGEEYVYKYLDMKKQLPAGQSIQTVTWINETLETGKPYDIEVIIDPNTVIYIEVKSTKTSSKEFVEFSWNELQFADKEKQNYHLYRVYNAGSNTVNMKWLENLSNVLDKCPVRLLLEL